MTEIPPRAVHCACHSPVQLTNAQYVSQVVFVELYESSLKATPAFAITQAQFVVETDLEGLIWKRRIEHAHEAHVRGGYLDGGRLWCLRSSQL